MTSKMCDGDEINVFSKVLKNGDSNSVYDEHILQMRPSPELITYYQNKIKDMQKYELDLEEQLDRCKKVCEDSSYTQDELLQRNKEVSELKKVVSDLQVYLYQEREHVLQLSAENDRLRLSQLEYQKKLDTVLSFSGLPKDFVTFVSIEPNTTVVPNKRPISLKVNMKKDLKCTQLRKELIKDVTESKEDLELLHVQALIAEWEEQSELYRDEIHSLLLDRDLREKEVEGERQQLQDQISHLNKMLKSVQSRVCDEASRLVIMEKRHQAREAVWMDEKADLLKNLELIHQLLHTPARNTQFISSQLSALKKQLGQKDEIVSMYQEQSTTLEDEVEKLKDTMEKDKLQLKDKNSKMMNQVKYFKHKCDEEKRRRLLDAEGFRNDIKFLRNRVQSLERKVLNSVSQARAEVASQIKIS